MAYFRERNNLRKEYSGFGEVSQPLRSRLAAICERYISRGHIGIGNEGWWVTGSVLDHAIKLNLNKPNILTILTTGTYDEVFDAIEIFLEIAFQEVEYSQRKTEILSDVIQAFEISGSVYFVNAALQQIELRITEELAKDIDKAGEVLASVENAKEEFLSSIGGLMSRQESPENIVKGIFISFEDYLRVKTEAKEFGGAVAKLQAENIISPTQKALLEKIYAYRSDTYGVGHAGNNKKPDEIDTLWFLETVIAQILLIDRKVNQKSS